MLYIGILEVSGVNRLYLSSVPVESDAFETESVLADCSHEGRKDFEIAKIDLRILENKLRNAGVPGDLVVQES